MMLLLVACLNPKDLREVTTRYPVGPISGLARVEEHCPSAFDSHFHLDRTRTKLHLPGASYGTVCDAVEAESCHRVTVEGGVAVYCDPPTYPSRAEVQQLADVGVGVAIGMHPRYANSTRRRTSEAFGKCLTYPGVVALGEVGH